VLEVSNSVMGQEHVSNFPNGMGNRRSTRKKKTIHTLGLRVI